MFKNHSTDNDGGAAFAVALRSYLRPGKIWMRPIPPNKKSQLYSEKLTQKRGRIIRRISAVLYYFCSFDK